MGRLSGHLATQVRPSELRPGDTHIIRRPSGDEIIVVRTTRPYIEDLCDGLNANLRRSDIMWAVAKDGQQLYLRSRSELTH